MRFRPPGALALGSLCMAVAAAILIVGGVTAGAAEDPAAPFDTLSGEVRGVVDSARVATFLQAVHDQQAAFFQAVHDQQVAAYLAAAARPPRYDHWIHIHNCEQPDGDWHAKNGRLGGGLGILHAAWRDFGGREFSSTAAEATPEQQMIVANRIYDRYGPRAWGCK